MHRSVDGTPAQPGLAATGSVDAEVIRLAAEVESIEAAWSATFDQPANTRAGEAARKRLARQREQAAGHLATLTPRTLPGLIALARAAQALAERDADGDFVARDDADLLRLTLMEAVAALGEAQTSPLAQ